VAARNRQIERYRTEKKTYANAQMMPKMIRKHCGISAEGEVPPATVTKSLGTLSVF
jgi:predicted ATPase with chaperone activity